MMTIRKITLILAFLAAVLCGRAQSGSPFDCDTTGISTFNAPVNGKLVPAALIYCSEDKHTLSYELRQPFMENGTQYIWRSYHFYKCDTCSTYDTCISSFYWCKHCLEQIFGKYYANEPDFSGTEWFTLGADYRYYREFFPDLTLTQNNLGNMPRNWFCVRRFQGKYAVTSDYPHHKFFTDSLVVCYGMEAWFNPLRKVKELGTGTYYYEDDYYDRQISGLAKSQNWLLPSILAKGLYVETTLLADGTLTQELVTPEENLQYFDCINSKLCDLWYLDYDTVNYDAHTDPALMKEIRSLQHSIAKRAGERTEPSHIRPYPSP